jgi:hypothetical protein
VGYLPEDADSCSDLEGGTCTGLSSCSSCVGCTQQLLDYVNCLNGYQCSLDCPDPGPTDTPTDKPTDTPTDECPTELAAFNNCGSNPKACYECVKAYFPSEIDSCTDIDDETCTGLSNCPACSGCDAELVDLLNCWTEDQCSLSCEGPTDAPEECPTELAAFNNCGSNPKACYECVKANFPSEIDSCTDIDDETCTGLSNCQACSGCGTELVDLLNCWTDDQCSLECAATDEPTEKPDPPPPCGRGGRCAPPPEVTDPPGGTKPPGPFRPSTDVPLPASGAGSFFPTRLVGTGGAAGVLALAFALL